MLQEQSPHPSLTHQHLNLHDSLRATHVRHRSPLRRVNNSNLAASPNKIKSDIDPVNPDGELIPDNIDGDIKFQSVIFNYSTRVVNDTEEDSVQANVLESFSLNIAPGSNHALVGKSGCGKNTTVRLIERFYDLTEGKLTIDGNDVRDLNVRWLRS